MSYDLNSTAVITNILSWELASLDNVHGHNPETGTRKPPGGLLGEYTNRLFGAPYQLLDSVDARFPSINRHVGTEYLRNFLLHSPILYIRPGRPQYSGGKGNENTLRDIFFLDMPILQALGNSLSRNLPFRKGSQLQGRMYGFREMYMNYMSYVNYMCRCMAIYLGLDTNENSPDLPFGVHLSSSSGKMEFVNLSEVRWENYRMMNSYVQSVAEYFWGSLVGGVGETISGSAVGRLFGSLISVVKNIGKPSWQNSKQTTVGSGAMEANTAIDNMAAFLVSNYGGDVNMIMAELQKTAPPGITVTAGAADIKHNTYTTSGNPLKDNITNKVKTVAFMVEPQPFSEQMSNETSASMIKSAVDGLTGSIGSEIAFMTNSNTEVGIIDDLLKAVGGTVEGIAQGAAQFMEPITGGFMGNLFSGALGALKGQKMIYPDIYTGSRSTMDYEFKVNLVSPYGDNYNYYMNIVVPLMHLIALTAPKLTSSNNTSSPFLVQAYIPGMMTCQLGIVESMTITKNPNSNHVSVSGFPLSIQVSFKIKELYNSLAISSAHDPASFMFNETLNDYMTNLAGLIPGVDTYLEKKGAAFQAVGEYFTGGIVDDILYGLTESWENTYIGYV